MILQPTLQNERILIRPLLETDFKDLYEVASDPLIWEQHPFKNRYQLDVFTSLFQDSLKSGGALVVIDKSTSKIIGSSRYYEADLKKGDVVIGYTFLARKYWGGEYNRQMKHLMINHALTHFKRALFHVDSNNIRSQKAMEKIGGHLFREFEKSGRIIFEYAIDRPFRGAF